MSTHGYAHESDSVFAMDLAQEFIHQFHGEEGVQEQERVCWIVLCAGAHVAETAEPGAWASFEPESFLRAMPHQDHRDELLTRVVLVGFFAFLAFRAVIPSQEARRIVAMIHRGGQGEPMLEELCRATTTVLEDVGSPPR